ncbi:5-methyltetrahydropteroyltriglutamate--homocysteine S-methyltransferase [Salipaludibacillus sp. HK11]|uniref:5-methyltetrahydropteroyltriglutamate-- homocysteine S-methyltransferase n=1 Tax=Salipaludibacillus sp. HK11 TaxID=3394320 RepID=UPI0039FC8AD5
MELKTSVQGYPRIGEEREWKRTLESYWKKEFDQSTFQVKMKDIRLDRLKKLKQSDLDIIPVGDFSYYDHMLDTATMFGLIPNRFKHQAESNSLDLYFAMARGSKNAEACEMTKWYNTNYHYIVPEFENDWVPKLTENKPLNAFLEAKEELNINGKPVIIGPYSFLSLSKGYPKEKFSYYLDILLTLYAKVIGQLTEAGADLIQIDEPHLVTSLTDDDIEIVKDIYEKLADLVPNSKILLQTYFDSVSHYEQIVHLPVAGIGLDMVYDKEKHVQYIKDFGFPNDKILSLGCIDGKNIWKTDLNNSFSIVKGIREYLPNHQLHLQSSCSLLHSPVSLGKEKALNDNLVNGLAFADEKLEELRLLKGALTDKDKVLRDWEEHQQKVDLFKDKYQRSNDKREGKIAQSYRSLPFSERHTIQQKKWQLPILPTTTIGSFPQTLDMRKARTSYRRGELTEETYQGMVEEKIQRWITIQESLGLDVFVHGEFERNDMVEYFGEKLNGFAVTTNGWVQSYGSRCVKPPVIYADVTFDKPMTVRESAYAQSLTDKPVKGMLTGPVTILNWSFERNDIPAKAVADQIAEALTSEIYHLEQSGVEMIQVDEPALREGLPLKVENQAEYLKWAVESFRSATYKVKDTTQIHTHMCYSEFHEMIDSIKDMDADVISIETSKSHGKLIRVFETNVYDKGIGLGVYDIHSPRIPKVEEMSKVIEESLGVLPPFLFWVNPDCGLKTRTEDETVSALKNMVEATHLMREKVKSSVKI